MTATLPEGRYPASASRRPVSRRIQTLLLALVLVVGLGIAFVGYQRFAVADVEATALTFDLVDDSTLSITFSVTRPDSERDVVCIVRARSYDGTETGRRELLVPPAEQTTVQVTTLVKTSAPAVVGDVYGCGTEVPSYLVGG